MSVVGIRFKRVSKTYYFDPVGLDLVAKERVVVETTRGIELGEVVIPPKELPQDQIPEPLKPVIRRAEAADLARSAELEVKEKEALQEGTKLVSRLNLPMKLISADYNLDASRVTIYFTAEERVDFRELVREMAGRLHSRVELRQVGPRDEAKLIGGFGRCGRQLCCGSFLTELAPVSMKMAKDQGLPLNPMKISGCCGRLMCCLGYECEQYREMRKNLPKEGQRVITPSGAGRVVGVSPLTESVTVQLDESQAAIDVKSSELKLEQRVDAGNIRQAQERPNQPTDSRPQTSESSPDVIGKTSPGD